MSPVVRHQKFGIPVQIAMTDRTRIIGVLFVRQSQRVIEVLCDDRAFFPVETIAGVRLLNKQHVVQIDLLPIAEILENRGLCPDIDVHYLSQNIW